MKKRKICQDTLTEIIANNIKHILGYGYLFAPVGNYVSQITL